MRRSILITTVIILIILTVGYVFYFLDLEQNELSNDTQMKNAEMLDNGNDTAIIIQSDVEYYKGAKGYFVRPEKEGNYPGVVMIHENRGLRPEIKDTAKQLAKEGYLVLAVDLYDGQVVETQAEAREISSSFNQETGTENLKAAAEYLRNQGVPKLASLGWCFGGRQSLELSTSGEQLDATVVYYGGGMPTTVEELDPIKWPVLGVFGDQDRVIPVEMVNTFQDSLNALNVENEIHIYEGVGHAFANPSGPNYAPDATMDAWSKTLSFLEKNLK